MRSEHELGVQGLSNINAMEQPDELERPDELEQPDELSPFVSYFEDAVTEWYEKKSGVEKEWLDNTPHAQLVVSHALNGIDILLQMKRNDL